MFSIFFFVPTSPEDQNYCNFPSKKRWGRGQQVAEQKAKKPEWLLSRSKRITACTSCTVNDLQGDFQKGLMAQIFLTPSPALIFNRPELKSEDLTWVVVNRCFLPRGAYMMQLGHMGEHHVFYISRVILNPRLIPPGFVFRKHTFATFFLNNWVIYLF